MSRQRSPRIFSREFKLAAVRRMLAGENVSALSRELTVLRKDLYVWRKRFRAGGAEALRGRGRPRKARWRRRESAAKRARRSRRLTRPRRSGLPNWSARSASSSWIWIFFGKPCGKSGKHAGRATGLARRRLRGHPGDDDPAAARRTHDRADVRAGRRQPRRLLPALAGLGAAPGGDRGARRDPARWRWRTGTTAIGGSRSQLRREGLAVNHKRVLRLMREDNLLCLRQEPFVPVTTDSRHGWRVVPNLARGMVPDRPRPALGRRHHLHPAARGVRLSGHRARCVQPPRDRLGAGDASAGEPGDRGARDGARVAPARHRAA